MNGTWLNDAVSLTEAFRSGERSPLEETQAVFDQIEKSSLNAFSYLEKDKALSRANQLDTSLPLGGVPIAVKELHNVKGWPDTGASLVFTDRFSQFDSTMIQRLKAAGANLIGLSTASEFGGLNCSTTKLNGITTNPWNHDLTPGGSSGGGAAPTSSIVPGNPSPDPNHPQPQGNAGGHGGSNGSRGGGGGGGAGSDGGNASGSYPGGLAGYGGKALQVAIAGPPTLSAAGTPGPSGQGWYAGGGGGAGADETFPDSKRGIGGRGNDRTGTTAYGGGGNGAPGGSPAVPRDSMNGLSGTGGGGGGGRLAPNYGGSGGSGIVVVRYQIGSVNTAKASGGAVSFYNNKTIHVFTGSGTFSSDNPFNETCECVIIGGGAGTGNPSSSGAHGAGGGGAGAVYDRNNVSLNLSGPFSFNVTIGAGGNRSVAPGNKGVNGSPSIVAFPTGTLTAPGGGAGGISETPTTNTNGENGGAGGGASNYSSGDNPHPGGTGAGAPWPGTPGNDPGSGWGGNGGNSDTAAPAYGGGGGGGAKDGGNGNGSAGGGGGGAYKIPTTYTDPNATYGYAGPGSTHFWFAGGGGGGTYDGSPGTEGVGGGGPNLSTPYGGSGKGGYRTGPGGESARANSGAGAGGGGGGNSSPGANGGSGSWASFTVEDCILDCQSAAIQYAHGCTIKRTKFLVNGGDNGSNVYGIKSGTGASDATWAIESCLFVGWDKWAINGSGGYCTVRNCTLVLDESSQSTAYLMYWSGTNVAVYNTLFYGGASSVDYGLRLQSASSTHTVKNCISFGSTNNPYTNTGSPTVSSQLETNTEVVSDGNTIFTAIGDAGVGDDYTINTSGLAYQRGLAAELGSDGKDVDGNDYDSSNPNIGAYATVASGWSAGSSAGGVAVGSIASVTGVAKASISKISGV